MSKRFSIRTLFLATFVVALCVIGISNYLPYVNDSWFVSRCFAHQGATFHEFRQFTTGMSRSIEETYDQNNNVMGLEVRTFDGRVIYLLMSDSDRLSSKINGPKIKWDEIRISSVHKFDIIEETSAGLVLSRTGANTPKSGR